MEKDPIKLKYCGTRYRITRLGIEKFPSVEILQSAADEAFGQEGIRIGRVYEWEGYCTISVVDLNNVLRANDKIEKLSRLNDSIMRLQGD